MPQNVNNKLFRSLFYEEKINPESKESKTQTCLKIVPWLELVRQHSSNGSQDSRKFLSDLNKNTPSVQNPTKTLEAVIKLISAELRHSFTDLDKVKNAAVNALKERNAYTRTPTPPHPRETPDAFL